MDQSKKLINLLANEDLAKFLNIAKLVTSTEFSRMAEYAATHSVAHGDHSYIVKLLKPLTGSPYFYSAVGWFCSRAALEYADVKGVPTFTKSASAPNGSLKILEVIKAKPARLKSGSKSVSASAHAIVETKKPKKRLKKVDMLDSWARLPGSFGGGKRS
jgi:hypothetical protein